jgi:Uma2 family endonuclease
MATTTIVPVETYLRTVSEPDCECVDGEIEQRPIAEYDHATWQGAILVFFQSHGTEWDVRARAELRMKVSPTRHRVPDVTVLDRAAPIEQIVTTAPLAVFEIFSPEDTIARMMEKLGDYERMDIQGIWIIDPKANSANHYQNGALAPTSHFHIGGTAIDFTLEDLAAALLD